MSLSLESTGTFTELSLIGGHRIIDRIGSVVHAVDGDVDGGRVGATLAIANGNR